MIDQETLDGYKETLELDRDGELDPDFKRYWWIVDNLISEVENLQGQIKQLQDEKPV